MTAIPLAVVVPLLGAALLAAGGRAISHTVANAIALPLAVATAGLCVAALAEVGMGLDVYWFGAWQPRDGIAIGVDFAVDAFGAGLAAFVAGLTVLAMVMLIHYRETDPPHLQVLLLVFGAGMIGFCFSGDLFNMFVFFELMSVAAFALTGFRARQEEAVEGSLNFAITNTIGSFLILIGIALVYARTGALNLAQIGEALAAGSVDGLVVVAFALLVGGLLVKAAIVPFHFWLADAYAVAPTPVCLLFAGAMSELGIYGVGRIWFSSFSGALAEHTAAVGTVLIVAGCLTALVGGVMCLAQDHLKRMLAFATISYVGVFLVGLGTFSEAGLAGAALFTVADGANKAALFGAVGIVQHRAAELSEPRLRGKGRTLPFTAALVVMGAISFAAVPPFGAFSAKALIEDAVSAAGHGWAIAVLVVTPMLTAAAVLRALGRVFFGWGTKVDGSPDRTQGEANEEAEDEEEVSRETTPATLFVPAALLALAALALGLVPGLVERFERAAATFIDAGRYAGAVLEGAAPAPPPVPESFAAPSSAYVYAALTAVGALALAGAALWGARGGWSRRAQALAGAAIGPLATLHSGHVGDYVAWLVLGVAALGGGLAIAS